MNAVEIDAVQKVDGFNFGYALELDPKFIELEYPFYWADVYELTHEFYDLRLHGVAFSKMKIVMLPLPEGTNALDDFRDEAISLFSEKPIRVPHGGRLRPGHKLFQLQPRGENSAFRIEIESPGEYALFAEKSIEEFQAALCGPSGIVELQQVLVFKSKSSHGFAWNTAQRGRQNRSRVSAPPINAANKGNGKMPGRVASTVARPAERRQIYAQPNLPAQSRRRPIGRLLSPEESHRDHEEDRKQA